MTVLKTLPDLSSVTSTLAEPLDMNKAIESSSSIHFKYWTVQEYHRMSDLGILDPSQRTELIAGQIVLMTAKGTPHVLTLRLLATALESHAIDLYSEQVYWITFLSQNQISL